MTQNYPIIEERFLQEPPKRGAFGLRGRRRDYDEVPRPKGGQVLVYNVGGRHIVDDGRLGLDDDRVLAATSVSVVDVSDRVPVVVRLPIPSKDASEFTIQADFLCTVTDPEEVVGKGKQNASAALLGYLRGHHRVFELGLPFEMSRIHEVRRDVKAQILAYTMNVRPPIPGMSVTLNSVEVLTPDELRDVHTRLRKGSTEHQVASQQEHLGHDLERLRAEQSYVLERMRQQFDQEKAVYERKMTEERRLFDEWLELEVARQRRIHAQQEYAEIAPLVGEDSLSAAVYAAARGDIGTTDVVRALEEAQDRARADDKEMRQERLADQRERERAERVERERFLELARESRLEQHTDERQARQNERADEQQRRRMVQQIIGKLAESGYLDENSPDMRRLVQGLMLELVPSATDELQGLEAPTAQSASLDKPDSDGELREEDVN
ncbi:hypothetical protein OHR68_41655 [Spirillospora sp. NBC_00431]